MTIGGPQLAHTMQAAEGGNVRIVYLRTDNLSFPDGMAQLDPVFAHLSEKREAWRLQPGIDLIERDRKGRWGIEDRGMGYDG